MPHGSFHSPRNALHRQKSRRRPTLSKILPVGRCPETSIHYLRDLNPSETYLLVLGKEKTIEVKQTEIQYVFEQSGKHSVQLLEKGAAGFQVIDQFEIQVRTDRTVAVY